MSRRLGFSICALLSVSQWAIVYARLSTGQPLGWVWFNVVSGMLCAVMALDIALDFPLLGRFLGR